MSCGRRGFFDIDLLARSTLPCEALNESKRVLGLVDSRASCLVAQRSDFSESLSSHLGRSL